MFSSAVITFLKFSKTWMNFVCVYMFVFNVCIISMPQRFGGKIIYAAFNIRFRKTKNYNSLMQTVYKNFFLLQIWKIFKF